MINKELIIYICKFPLVFPHLITLFFSSSKIKELINEDLAVMNKRCKKQRSIAFFLIFRRSYRNLFYNRIPKSRYFRILLPEYPLFTLVSGLEIGGGAFVLNHPYATILNAKKIGKNFVCCHLTTIGNGKHGDNTSLPTIGNDVTLGANVTIIGGVTIGNNVTIGAGSVVVKDIPDNCVAVGNPVRIIQK